MSDLVVQAIVTGSVYTLVALAFSLIYAGSRIINFAQGDFVAAGGVALAVLTVSHGVPLGLALLASAAVISVVGFVVVRVLVLPTLPGVLDRTVNEQAQLRWVLTTIGASVTIEAIANSLSPGGALAVRPYIGGTVGLFGTRVGVYSIFVVLVVVAIVVTAVTVTSATQQGRRLLAVAQDRYAAEVVGIQSTRTIIALFVMAALFSALAGVLIAPITQADATAGFRLGLAGFAAATVGGLGDIRGAPLGGLIIGFAEVFGTRYVDSQLESVFPLVVLFLVLMIRPRGILQSAFVDRV